MLAILLVIDNLAMFIPGWAPSSMTCIFDVTCPALTVLDAKQIRIESLSFPGTCMRQYKTIFNLPATQLQSI